MGESILPRIHHLDQLVANQTVGVKISVLQGNIVFPI